MFSETELINCIPNLTKAAKKLTKTDPEDLVQDTLERAIRYQDKFDDEKGKLECWLIHILHNIFYDRCKKSANDNLIIDNVQRPNQVKAIRLQECWQLPNAKIAFASGLGYSQQEIANKTNSSQSAVFRSLQQFYKHKDNYV